MVEEWRNYAGDELKEWSDGCTCFLVLRACWFACWLAGFRGLLVRLLRLLVGLLAGWLAWLLAVWMACLLACLLVCLLVLLFFASVACFAWWLACLLACLLACCLAALLALLHCLLVCVAACKTWSNVVLKDPHCAKGLKGTIATGRTRKTMWRKAIIQCLSCISTSIHGKMASMWTSWTQMRRFFHVFHLFIEIAFVRRHKAGHLFKRCDSCKREVEFALKYTFFLRQRCHRYCAHVLGQRMSTKFDFSVSAYGKFRTWPQRGLSADELHRWMFQRFSASSCGKCWNHF